MLTGSGAKGLRRSPEPRTETDAIPTMPHHLKPLRRLAIHVEESRAQSFRWILSEVDASDVLHALQRANTSFETYHAAMAGGLRALEALIDDLDVGPRQEGATGTQVVSDASQASGDLPKDSPAPRRRTPASEASGKSTAFGFGLPS